MVTSASHYSARYLRNLKVGANALALIICLLDAATGLLTLYSLASSVVTRAPFSIEAAALDLSGWTEEDAPNAMQCK